MSCDTTRARLAEDPGCAATDAEVRAHLAECERCSDLERRLREVDEALGALEPVEPKAGLVHRTVRAVQEQRSRPLKAYRLAMALGSLIVVLPVLGFIAFGMGLLGTKTLVVRGPVSETADTVAPVSQPAPEKTKRKKPTDGWSDGDRGERAPDDVSGARSWESAVERRRAAGRWSVGSKEPAGDDSGREETAKGQREQQKREAEPPPPGIVAGKPVVRGALDKSVIRRSLRQAQPAIDECCDGQLPASGEPAKLAFVIESDGRVANTRIEGGEDRGLELDGCLEEAMEDVRFPSPKGGGVVAVRMPLSSRKTAGGEKGRHLEGKSEGTKTTKATGTTPVPTLPALPEPELVDLEALPTLPAKGYFRNTYLPGDPELQWLERSLAAGLRLDGRRVPLAEGAQPYAAPFDAPESEGLALHLATDRTALEGPARVTLQVALTGSLRHARRRAPLNAALVIDLRRAPSEETRRALWTLAETMAADLQAGDRFHLVVAGAGAPVVVLPARFRSSELRKALADTVLSAAPTTSAEPLADALGAAYAAVRGGSAKDAPLGANLVLLAASGPLDGVDGSATETVRQAALDGVTLTTLGVGPDADLSGLGRLAAVGQGRRRLVQETERARAVLQEELAASGAVVARALRLRIRLAEGVRLVEVVGSEPLTHKATQRVREAEVAIDRRVSATLGIEADRGEDEEGIQIVIPTFYAGDGHSVVLDLVVPGPGPVADVRVRYKDLVRTTNAVASASLSLPAGRTSETPSTLAVRKALLGLRVASDLRGADEALGSGDATAALRHIATAEARVRRLAESALALRGDGELAADRQLLTNFDQVLRRHEAWSRNAGVRTYIRRALRYAARKKVAPGSVR